MTKGETSFDRRAVVCATVLAAALFCTLAAAAVARSIIAQSYPELMQPFIAWLPESTPVGIAVAAVIALILGVCAYFLFSRFSRVHAALSRFAGPNFLALGFSKRSVILAAIILLVVWLPILIIMFPTGLTADTLNQLYQFQTHAPTLYPTTEEIINAEFIDHHPVFDTLLYGAFWSIGNAMGSQNAGLFILVIVQSVILAAELGVLVCYLDRLGIPWVLRCAALVFFALFPFFAHYAATILKDVTYLTVFIPWTIMWLEAARTRGAVFDDKRFLVAFFVLGGLGIITKKLGLFVLVPCLVALVAIMRGRRLPLAVGSIVTVVVFSAILPAIVYPAIGGVAPGGRQETLGPAIQQMTALLRDTPDALTSEELEAVNRVFDVEAAKDAYEAPRTDGAKSMFKSSATTDDIMRFMQIWAAQGIRHPGTYLMSTAMTAGMLYVPSLKLTYYSGEDLEARALDYAATNPDYAVNVYQPEDLIALNDRLEFDSIESAISDLPVISLFFTSGFYGSWVPLIALISVIFARKRVNARLRDRAPLLVFALVPTIVCCAFLIVSPVASPRYILPLLFTAPLLLGWAWFALKEQTTD